MRHITDGELHLYLDGALDLIEETRGEEIREHLTLCSACSERFQDEEELRTRAQALLGVPAVEVGAMPAFEELRARAEVEALSRAEVVAPGKAGVGSRTTRRGLLKGLPLAWAATIVLALGVGWMGGKFQQSMPNGFSVGLPETDSEAVPAPGVRASIGIQEQESEPAQAMDRLTSGSEPGEVQADVAPEARGVVGPPSADAPSTKIAAGASVEELGREDVAEGAEHRARIAVDSFIPSMAMQLLAGESVAYASEPERREASVPGLLAEDVVDSVSAEGGSLTVPWLEVLSMDWEEWFPGERALRIRQLLPMGDTLELRYVGMLIGTDPAGQPKRISGELQEKVKVPDQPLSPVVMQASLPPGWNQVVRPLGRGWLVARAALPEPQIRALVDFIR